MTVSSSL